MKHSKIFIKKLTRIFLQVIVIILFALYLYSPLKAQTTYTIVDGALYDHVHGFEEYYNYSFVEYIYTKTKLNTAGCGAGTITSIQLKHNGTGCATGPVRIYMGHTSKSNFTGTSDWITSGLTLVYDGNITPATNNWYTITLSTSFYYNNSDNLVILFDNDDGSYCGSSSSEHYYADGQSDYYFLGQKSDVNDNELPAPASSGSRYTEIANLKITLTTCTSPSNQATSFTASSIAQTTMTPGWTRGTPSGGNNVLVVAKAGSAPSDPICGTSYNNPQAAYGTGDAVGGGYVIYKGTGTSVNVTNIAAGTTYYFAIYEFFNTDFCYNLTELTGNATTLKNSPTTQAYNITFSDVICTSMSANWLNGNGDKRVVKINTTNSFIAPSDGTDPSANSLYSGSGEQVVYNGNGTTVNITGLTVNTQYWFRVYEYNNSGTATKYNTSAATDNPKSQSTMTSCGMTWLGNTTVWETGTNWNPAGPPSSVYDVTIPASPSGGNQPTIAGNAVCGNITNNGTITMNSSSYDLSIYGNYNGSGTFAGSNNSSVYFKGSGNTTISGSPTFPLLWIQKNAVTNTVTANRNIISSGLYIRKGTLDMGGSSGYDLTTTSYAPYIGWWDAGSYDGKLYIHDANTLVQFQGAGNHLTIYPYGTLDMDAGELRITNGLFEIPGGNLDMSGGIIRQQIGTDADLVDWGGTSGCNITISGGDIYFESDDLIVGTTTSVNITGGTFHFADDFWTSDGSNWDPSGGTAEFYSAYDDGWIVNGDNENSWFWNLTINKSGGKKVYHGGPVSTAYDDIVVKNDLYIGSNSTLSAKQEDVANYQGKIIVYNNWDNDNGGTYEEESGKVTFKGAQNSTIYSPYFEDFQDGNYTTNPVWTVQAGGWQTDILTGNYWLEGTDAFATERISTPSSQVYGTWEFKYSFDVATTNEFVRFFVMMSADNADPGGATADGYYVWVDGGITAGARLQLRRLDNGTPATLITTDWTPGTAWHTIRVTRNSGNTFEMFLDGVSQGTCIDGTYTTSSYIGIWNTGVNTNDNHKIDNIRVGDETFYKLVINKSDKAYTVNLIDDITVSYRFTLTSGTVTTGTYEVYLSSDWDDRLDDDQSGGTSSIFVNSWVYGNLRRVIDNPSSSGDTYWFPVGISNRSNPAVLIANGSMGGINDIKCYFKANPITPNLNFPALSEGGQTYTGVCTEGVWVMTPNGSITSGKYDLKLYYSGFSGLADNSFSILSRPIDLNNGTNWQLIGNFSNTTVASGYAYRVNCPTFSEKGISRASGPLPIELLSFSANCVNNNVILYWSTASETNNDYFTLEKSNYDFKWSVITTIPGAGNSNSTIDYSYTESGRYGGAAYYRLKQTDYDGKSGYSEIGVADCESVNLPFDLNFNLSPGQLNLGINSPENTEADLNVINILGQKIMNRKILLSKGSNDIYIDISGLAGSAYFLIVETPSGFYSAKEIIISK